MLLSSQIELKEVRKALRPFPIGLSLMIFDCGSAMADVTLSRWEGAERSRVSPGCLATTFIVGSLHVQQE